MSIEIPGYDPQQQTTPGTILLEDAILGLKNFTGSDGSLRAVAKGPDAVNTDGGVHMTPDREALFLRSAQEIERITEELRSAFRY